MSIAATIDLLNQARRSFYETLDNPELPLQERWKALNNKSLESLGDTIPMYHVKGAISGAYDAIQDDLGIKSGCITPERYLLNAVYASFGIYCNMETLFLEEDDQPTERAPLALSLNEKMVIRGWVRQMLRDRVTCIVMF